MFVFSDGDIEITSTLIEDNPLDYRKLLPEEFTTQITVDKSLLVNVIQRINVFSQKTLNSVILDWGSSKSKDLMLKSHSEIGEGYETIPISLKSQEGQTKDNRSVTLNAKFLQDVLRVMEGDKIIICCNSKLDPVLINDCQSGNKIDASYRHVIMPLKD